MSFKQSIPLRDLPIRRFMLPDTLGILNPGNTYEYCKEMVTRYPDLKFDFHAHNDYDLAVANVSLLAVRAGIKGLHTTLNGLGERAGNAPLSSVLAVSEVQTDYMYVDNAAMRMIQEPKFFDVMVTENTFGDILTDEGSCISGSMGLLPSASTGESTPVFEPIHGSWPQAKGLNIANPLAQILSVAMLFEYFGCKAEGALIREAVDASLDANVRTPEIQMEGGAKYGTKEVGTWIVNYINN